MPRYEKRSILGPSSLSDLGRSFFFLVPWAPGLGILRREAPASVIFYDAEAKRMVKEEDEQVYRFRSTTKIVATGESGGMGSGR